MKSEKQIRRIIETSESPAGLGLWLREADNALPYDVYTKKDVAIKIRQVIASTLRWVLEEETEKAKIDGITR